MSGDYKARQTAVLGLRLLARPVTQLVQHVAVAQDCVLGRRAGTEAAEQRQFPGIEDGAGVVVWRAMVSAASVWDRIISPGDGPVYSAILQLVY